MSKSLQDQLMSLGLAKSKPKPTPAKTRHSSQKGKQRRAAPRSGKAGKGGTAKSDENLSLEQAYRLRDKQARDQAEQARARKREEDRRRRQLNNEIRAIVEPNRLNSKEAELSRNFLYKGRIRKVNVTASQLKALNAGEIGIVYLSGGYHLLLADITGKVRDLSPDHVPDLSGTSEEEEEFPVPDDLLW